MRSLRREAIFERWTKEQRYERLSFTSFKDRCDAGEVEGLGPSDFRVSDTVTVDAEASPASEKREELPEHTQNQATPTMRPGPSGNRESSSSHTNAGVRESTPEQRTG